VDLSGANLEGAQLEGFWAPQSDFSNANLRNANLIGANLNSSDLTGADFEGATLDGADLLTLISTLGTKWPDGFDAERTGVTVIPRAWAEMLQLEDRLSTASKIEYDERGRILKFEILDNV
jgi:hypothetical protein